MVGSLGFLVRNQMTFPINFSTTSTYEKFFVVITGPLGNSKIDYLLAVIHKFDDQIKSYTLQVDLEEQL